MNSMNKLFWNEMEQRLSAVLQKEISIREIKTVYGGDINTTDIMITNEGKFFVKYNSFSTSDLFEKENNGLRLLQNRSRLKVPQPIVYGRIENLNFLVMEYIEKSAATAQTWQRLGEGIATLHRHTQPQFGLAEDNYIGSLPQQNRFAESWANFYAQRIMPLFEQAQQQGKCLVNDVKKAEMLCKKCNQLFPSEAPSLLHGDLWNGNIMACRGDEVAVYDPAVYYGFREMDIAMTLLFGGFDAVFYTHYNEVYQLEKGWQSRVHLCQLYPLLVHLILFGSAYYSRVINVLKQYQ